MVMCVTVPLMARLQTTNGRLQGFDRQALPMKNLAIGAVFKVAVKMCIRDSGSSCQSDTGRL